MPIAKALVAGVFVLMLAAAAAAEGPQIAQVKTVAGLVFITRGGARMTATPGQALYQGDLVETEADGTVGFTFIDNTVFSAGPDSQISLDQFRFDSSNFRGEMQAGLKKGSLTVVSGDIPHGAPGAMRIRTPSAILGVGGTTFAVKVY